MITTIKPHYLLFCEGNAGPAFGFPQDDASRWRFVLENVETGQKIEAWDYEEILHPDRISLMAVIRGLEALDQPSKVTLVTTNRYVARGLQYGLSEWRENDFCWEHFGSIQPIRNQDLWRRVDVALRYHEVTCRWMAYDTQEDRVDGDRRDVPVETLVMQDSKADETKESVSQTQRVGSRSFSAITRLANQYIQPTANSTAHNSTRESAVPCAVSDDPQAERLVDSSQTVHVSCGSSFPAESSQKAFEHWSKGLLRLIRLPGSWIWRLVLRADTILVYAMRLLLCLDPKPESYRARR